MSNSNPNRDWQTTTDKNENQLLEKTEKSIRDQEELECKILKSTQNSLKVLENSEKLATTTTNDLCVQHEQLKRLNYDLHDINSSLKKTNENINIVKNNFGYFKNFINKQREKFTFLYNKDSKPNDTLEKHGSSCTSKEKTGNKPKPTLDSNHAATNSLPVSKLELNHSNELNGKINENLKDISSCIGRLKGLAVKMGEELDLQNELIDDISVNTEKATITLHYQNQSITKLM